MFEVSYDQASDVATATFPQRHAFEPNDILPKPTDMWRNFIAQPTPVVRAPTTTQPSVLHQNPLYRPPIMTTQQQQQQLPTRVVAKQTQAPKAPPLQNQPQSTLVVQTEHQQQQLPPDVRAGEPHPGIQLPQTRMSTSNHFNKTPQPPPILRQNQQQQQQPQQIQQKQQQQPKKNTGPITYPDSSLSWLANPQKVSSQKRPTTTTTNNGGQKTGTNGTGLLGPGGVAVAAATAAAPKVKVWTNPPNTINTGNNFAPNNVVVNQKSIPTTGFAQQPVVRPAMPMQKQQQQQPLLQPLTSTVTLPPATTLSINSEKAEILYQLQQLEMDGVPMSRRFTLDDDLDEMRFAFYRGQKDRDAANSLKRYRKSLITIVSFITVLLGAFNLPFGISFDGLLGDFNQEMDQFYPAFRKIHEKYSKNKFLDNFPEVQLLWRGGETVLNRVMKNFQDKRAEKSKKDAEEKQRQKERNTALLQGLQQQQQNFLPYYGGVPPSQQGYYYQQQAHSGFGPIHHSQSIRPFPQQPQQHPHPQQQQQPPQQHHWNTTTNTTPNTPATTVKPTQQNSTTTTTTKSTASTILANEKTQSTTSNNTTTTTASTDTTPKKKTLKITTSATAPMMGTLKAIGDLAGGSKQTDQKIGNQVTSLYSDLPPRNGTTTTTTTTKSVSEKDKPAIEKDKPENVDKGKTSILGTSDNAKLANQPLKL